MLNRKRNKKETKASPGDKEVKRTKPKLSSEIVLVFVLVFIPVQLVTIALPVIHSLEGSRAYAIELLHYQTSNMVEFVVNSLSVNETKRVRLTNQKELKRFEYKHDLPRVPIRKETFISKNEKGELIAFRRTKSGALESGELDINLQSCLDYGSNCTITNSYGKILHSTIVGQEELAELNSRLSNNKFMATGLAKMFGTIDQGNLKADLIFGYREIPDTNMIFYYEQSTDKLWVPILAFVVKSLMWAVLLVVAMVLIGTLILRKILAPFKTLLGAVSQISAGDFKVSVPELRYHELNLLGESIEASGKALGHRETKLLEAHENARAVLKVIQELSESDTELACSGRAIGWLLRRIGQTQGASVTLKLFEDDRITTHDMNVSLGGECQVLHTNEVFVVKVANDEPGENSEEDEGKQESLEACKYEINRSRDILVCELVRNETRLADLSIRFQLPIEKDWVTESFVVTIMEALAGVLTTLRFRDAEKVREQLDRELQASQFIQEGFLPTKEAVRCAVLEWTGFYLPAGHVGGDWYGVHYDEFNYTVYACVADVTGHGVKSAMLTGLAHGVFSTLCRSFEQDYKQGENLSVRLTEIAESLNKIVYDAAQGETLMTSCMMAMDLRNLTTHILCAGHPSPVHFSSNYSGHCVRKVIQNRNEPLGLSPNSSFQPLSMTLAEGDQIFLYTDGLFENECSASKRFTKRDIYTMLAKSFDEASVNESADRMRADLEAKITERWEGCVVEDDTSFLIIGPKKKNRVRSVS